MPRRSGSRNRQSAIFVLDHSLSEGAEGLTKVYQAARQIAAGLPGDVEVGYVAAGSEGEVIAYPKGTGDPSVGAMVGKLPEEPDTEVMARLGRGQMQGFGRHLQLHGFHPTSILGRFGAAAVGSAVLGLPEAQIAHALGVAATTAGGLTASFGTMSKPFHAGKAAMDGILAAQLVEIAILDRG